MKKYFARLEHHAYDEFKQFLRPLYELPFKTTDTNITAVDTDAFPDRGTLQIYHKPIDPAKHIYEISYSLKNLIDADVEYLIVEFESLDIINLRQMAPPVEVTDADLDEPRETNMVKQALKGDKIRYQRLPGDQFYEVVDISASFDELLKRKYIYYHHRPLNKRLLLRLYDGVYGPFQSDFSPDDGRIELSAVEDNKSVKKYDPDVIDAVSYEFTFLDKSNYDTRRFIYSHQCLPDEICSFDFITDEQLRVLFKQFLNKHKGTYTKAQLKLLKDIISTTPEDSFNFSQRQLKILEMLDSLDANSDLIIGHINGIIEAAEDPDRLDRFVKIVLENHFPALVDRLQNDERYIELLTTKQNELERIKTEIAKERAELESINVEQVKRQIREAAEKESAELNREIKEKRAQLDNLKLLIESHTNEHGVRMDYDRVKTELKMLSADRDAVKHQLTQGFEDALVKGHLSATLLAEAFSAIPSKKNATTRTFPIYPQECIHNFSADSVIDAVHKNLATRNFSREDVANILICITQGFVTVFAGDPGTGKSSLCSILAKSLGLVHPDSSRFIEISVERGWSSRKDFVGYYNPLTGQLEYPNQALLYALEEMNANINSHIPLLVLLDEANLSPIEHYWADFMRIADFDNHRSREINLGNKNVFRVGDNMRFLATINFDHTTEMLSPRFLDRAWVIIPDSDGSYTPDFEDDDIENSEKVFSMDMLRKLFSNPPDGHSNEFLFDNTTEIVVLWKKIKTAYHSNKINIHPRCEKMLRHYCGVASRYMPEAQALDFAFSQKILPSTYGYNDKYRGLLENLCKITVNTMPKSYGILTRILENGANNMGCYQFFSQNY